MHPLFNQQTFKVNLIRARDLSAIPSFPVLKEQSILDPIRCYCLKSNCLQQHETHLVPNFVGEHFGIQVTNDFYDPSSTRFSIVVLIYWKEQLCYATHLPKGASQIIHSLRVATSERRNQVQTQVCSRSLNFEDSSKQEKSLLEFLFSTQRLKNGQFCPNSETDKRAAAVFSAQKWMTSFRVELWEIDPLHVPKEIASIFQFLDPLPHSADLDPISLGKDDSTSNSSSSSFSSKSKLPTAPLATIHLHCMSFSTLCELATHTRILNPYYSEVDLLYTLLEEKKTLSFPFAEYLKRRDVFPMNLTRELPSKLATILDRAPQPTRHRSFVRRHSHTSASLPSYHVTSSSAHLWQDIFSSPPPTPQPPPPLPGLHYPQMLSLSHPETNAHSAPAPACLDCSFPLKKPISEKKESRGSIQFLVQDTTPSSSPCTSPTFTADPPAWAVCSSSVDEENETLNIIAHTLTMLHTQCT